MIAKNVPCQVPPRETLDEELAGYQAGHTVADALSGKREAFDVYRYLMENAFQAYLQKLEQHYAQEQR